MGIDSALVQEGHSRAYRLGYNSAAVLGSPKYYNKFGYEKAEDSGVVIPFDVPSENCRAIELKAELCNKKPITN